MQLAFYTFRIIVLMLLFAAGPLLLNQLLIWLLVDKQSVLIWNDNANSHYMLIFVYVFSAYVGLMLYTSGKKKTAYVFFFIFLCVTLKQIFSYGYIDDKGYHYRTPYSLFEQHVLWKNVEEATFSPYIKTDGGRSSYHHLYIGLYLKEKNNEEDVAIYPGYTNDERWIHVKDRLWQEEHIELHFSGFTKNEESFLKQNQDLQQLFLIKDQEDWERRQETGFMREGFLIKAANKYEDYHYLHELMTWYSSEMLQKTEKMSTLKQEEEQLKMAKTAIIPLGKEWIMELKKHEPRTDEVLAYQKLAIADTILVQRFTELYINNRARELQTGTRDEKAEQELSKINKNIEKSKKKLEEMAATLIKQPASTK